MREDYEYEVRIGLSERDFELSMGRKPASPDEFDEWAMLVEKGLFNGHIDWDLLYECASDVFVTQQGGEHDGSSN
jgi:hypothetical protein